MQNHEVPLIVFSGYLFCAMPIRAAEGKVYEADICAYGGTASGVTAAIAAARRGNNIVIVDPFRHIGGMHGGGQACQPGRCKSATQT